MTKLNEIFTAEVRDISSEGNGVLLHPSGKTFFAPGVWVGEQGQFRITGFKARYGFAALVELTSPSPARITPPCPHHGFSASQCGGCAWQFVDYSAQLELKQQRVESLLSRFDTETGETVKPIWGSPDVFGYRNRAQFKTDGKSVGFVSPGSRVLAPIEDCLVLNEKNRQTLKEIQQTLPRKDLLPKEKKHRNKNKWNTIDIDDHHSSDTVYINQRLPFRQGNSAQNIKMREWLFSKLSALYSKKAEMAGVVELFSGSGNFTEIISKAGFKNILAVEGSRDALNALQEKNYSGVETRESNLFLVDGVAEIFAKNSGTQILVLDPPRDGLKGIEGLFSNPKHSASLSDIFYVSCNLATFGRDVERCFQQGFVLHEVQPLDQFPHTPHIEIMAHLVRV